MSWNVQIYLKALSACVLKVRSTDQWISKLSDVVTGLSGMTRIADVGGVGHLTPIPDLTRV